MLVKNKKSAFFFLAILAIPILAFTGFRWYEDNMEELPYFGRNYTIDKGNVPHLQVPDFSFTDQDSSAINNRFVKRKVWVVHFFFTSCPSICPKMIANLKLVQDAYGKDDQLKMLSLTVDPKYDTPSRLKWYAGRKGINTRQWAFATGSKKDLYGFARKALFIDATDGDGGEGDFIHSDKLVLIDRDLHIRGYYDGTDKGDIVQLIKDIKKLEN
ncbi:SCO family protein [Mucilaginibacter sp. McL0603]|uniref:SCO family protein n=1 Tax=Mucilaginibacter sp. McL0603 TaxID=3415670 RepID=UPI003CF98FA3